MISLLLAALLSMLQKQKGANLCVCIHGAAMVMTSDDELDLVQAKASFAGSLVNGLSL